jgi:hypothetical protein
MALGQYEPLGIFFRGNKQRYTIHDHHLQSFMREGVICNYRNPQHELRLKIKLLATHSLRITAAVALFTAGVGGDDILFQLCWNLDAVKFYLRECSRTIGELTSKVIAGAYLDMAPPLLS